MNLQKQERKVHEAFKRALKLRIEKAMRENMREAHENARDDIEQGMWEWIRFAWLKLCSFATLIL